MALLSFELIAFRPVRSLFDVAALFLPRALAGECLLGAAFVAGLQVEGVFLDVLDDVLLLELAFEPPEGTFNGFTFLNLDFRQSSTPPSLREWAHGAFSAAAGNTIA